VKALLSFLGLDGRRTSPEADHNEAAISAVIGRVVSGGLALELGSGSGEHALAWARRFPAITWQPSDPDPVQRKSVDAWIDHAPEVTNIRRVIALDAVQVPWSIDPPLALIVLVHVLHIAPRGAIEAIVAECRRLAPGGALVVHDAFLGADGRAASPRMRAFDHQLRKDNPQHGLRARSEIDAATSGLALIEDTTFDDDQRTLAYRIPC